MSTPEIELLSQEDYHAWLEDAAFYVWLKRDAGLIVVDPPPEDADDKWDWTRAIKEIGVEMALLGLMVDTDEG